MKALLPIDVTLAGMVTLSRPVQPENVFALIFVTPSGITMLMIHLQFMKALSPIVLTVSGMVIKVWYNIRWVAYFSLMKDTSWRPGEVVAFSKSGFFPHYNGSLLNAVYTSEEVHWRTHKIVSRIKTSHTKGGAKFKVGFISEQTVRLLQRLGQQVKGEYFFELRTDDLCFSHRRKNSEVQYIYSELANKRLRATAEAVGIDLAGRTQYRFRHTWDTENIGLIPEDLRNLIMGHVKTRKEYVHLSPEKAIAKVVTLAAAGQSIGSDKASNQ